MTPKFALLISVAACCFSAGVTRRRGNATKKYTVILYNHGSGETYNVWMEMTLPAVHKQTREIGFYDHDHLTFTRSEMSYLKEVEVYFYSEFGNQTEEMYAEPIDFEPNKVYFCYDVTGTFSDAEVSEISPCPYSRT